MKDAMGLQATLLEGSDENLLWQLDLQIIQNMKK